MSQNLQSGIANVSDFNSTTLGTSPSEQNMISAETVSLEIGSIVREAVVAHRQDGLKRAQDEVARLFGITTRRVRSYWNHEVQHVPAHEADRVRACRRAALRQRQKALNAELEQLQLRLAALGDL